jgi:hypothetical protein
MKNKKTVKKINKKKFTLHAIGNEQDFNYYIFDKKQEVIEKLSEMFSGVLKMKLSLLESYEDKKGNWKSKKINFEKIKDEHHRIQGYNINIRADLFLGSKKIFLILICSNKDRLKFNEELFKFFNMPKPKKFKPIEKTK